MHVAGVDPGFSGAIAVFDSKSCACLCAIDMPVIIAEKKELDENVIRSLFIDNNIEHVFIEKVSSMPKQGVVSMFRFGVSWGTIRGICAGLGIPYTLVIPQRWKKHALDGLGREKGYSILRAKQLFPDINLGKKKDHGRADAMLIAWYGIHFILR